MPMSETVGYRLFDTTTSIIYSSWNVGNGWSHCTIASGSESLCICCYMAPIWKQHIFKNESIILRTHRILQIFKKFLVSSVLNRTASLTCRKHTGYNFKQSNNCLWFYFRKGVPMSNLNFYMKEIKSTEIIFSSSLDLMTL